ncbi:hypothetical protein TRICI_001728 [Trichomonascus ciferrii]|uniref:DUF2470 domain-containing protein n=1 Tax=Trichomonascus ciferrii TaxID=44093 RepID=A0A642V920_9ASCO|nr:hypothetical protein TRICI_001728 [Trichomonascus ciferrii]
MNKDHTISLYDYLAHYGGVTLDPFDSRTSVKMTGIDLESITLAFRRREGQGEETKVIPIKPPMDTMSAARNVLVDMAREAANAQQVSPYQIKDYTPPSFTLMETVTISVTLFTMFVALYPSVALFFPYIGPLVYSRPLFPLCTCLATHSAESLFVLLPLLRKYRVPPPSRIKWVLNHLLEGYPTIQRFTSIAAKLES